MKRYTAKPTQSFSVFSAVVTKDKLSVYKPGTTYYKGTVDEILNLIENTDSNLWLKHQLTKDGFDALNFDTALYGSKVIGDTLYLCETDGRDIQVKKESVDPEEALDKYSPEELSAYIEPINEEVVHKCLTDYELRKVPVEDMLIDLLNEGYYLSSIVKSDAVKDAVESALE